MKSAVLCLSLALVVAACGRPVTEAECQEIVGRIAELELKATPEVSSTELQAEVARTKAVFHDDTMRDCVGKRVTEEALSCVRSATSARQIVEECFN
jgi:hypothetical protein